METMTQWIKKVLHLETDNKRHIERRAADRVSVPHSLDVYADITLDQGHSMHVVIQDISTVGVGVRTAGGEPWHTKAGQTLRFKLRFENEQVDLVGEVVRFRHDFLAFAFTSTLADRLVIRRLQGAALALQVRREHPTGNPVFISHKPLFLWFSWFRDRQATQWEMKLLRWRLCWSADGGLKTGNLRIHEYGMDLVRAFSPEPQVDWHTNPDEEMFTCCRTLVERMRCIDEPFTRQVLDIIDKEYASFKTR